MAYVIAGSCVKDDVCVDVCPAECIHPTRDDPEFETAEQLYINPADCVDCDACFEVCPVIAIFPREELPGKWEHAADLNALFFDR